MMRNNLIIIDSKKFTGLDNIPPKLRKLPAKVFSKPLAFAFNKSFNKGCLQKMLKQHALLPSINTLIIAIFSKIYETIVRDFLIIKMEHYFAPFISTY